MSVVCEPLEGVKFDIPRLLEHFELHVKPLPMHIQPGMGGNGGWSVLSRTGSYLDGWHLGALLISVKDGQTVIDGKAAKKMGAFRTEDYQKPTEICHGYLREVIETIGDLGLQPMRARIGLMRAGEDSRWHRDGKETSYEVRLHIPLITNPDVKWCTEVGEAHLPADGRAYLVPVNCIHLMKNSGATDRLHLYMDVRDTKGLSKHFKWNASSGT